MIDSANIVFIIAFIVLPSTIGLWALMTRRDILNRGVPPARRSAHAHTPPDDREMVDEGTIDASPANEAPTQAIQAQEPSSAAAFGHRQQPAISPLRDIPAQETIQMPAVEQSEVQALPPKPVTVSHRPLHFPRYTGRSAGVVKRVSANYGARR